MPEFLETFHDAQRLHFVKYARSRGFSAYDAEDIVNEAFLTLYRKRSEFTACDYPQAFGFKVLANAVADHARRLDRRPLPVDLGALSEERWATCDPNDEVIPRVDLQRAFDRLSERQAECLRLYYFVDLKTAAIAAYLGISASTVESHLDLGRSQLEKHLAGYGHHGSEEANA